jgi:hypothetical protein
MAARDLFDGSRHIHQVVKRGVQPFNAADSGCCLEGRPAAARDKTLWHHSDLEENSVKSSMDELTSGYAIAVQQSGQEREQK